MRVGVWQRAAVIVAVVAAGAAAVGCGGGNIFGANPGDGGCGFRPEGLIVDDITGTWEGSGQKFTLKLDGTVTGAATMVAPSPSGSASSRPTRPSASASRPSPGATRTTVEVTGRWTLKTETYLGDIEFSDVRSAQGPATFDLGGLYVSGTRRKPWMYILGEGDPDSCNILEYERTSRG